MTRRRFFIHTSLTMLLVMALSGTGGFVVGEASTLHGPSLVVAPETAETTDIQSALWDQTDTTGGDHVNSSLTAASDHKIADDFVITDTVNNYWKVTSIQVVGRYSPDPGYIKATSVNLQFYTDTLTNTKHLPGTLIYNAIVNTDLVSGTATINLPGPIYLDVGTPITYWVSIQANMVNTSHAWLWTERNSATPYNNTSPSVYKGTGGNGSCNTGIWKRRIADCAFPSSSTNVDMRFAVLGQAVLFNSFLYLPLLQR